MPEVPWRLGRPFWLAALIFATGGLIVFRGTAPPAAGVEAITTAPAGPIQHVVIIDQENHSFDNLLGVLCVQLHRCDGTTTGVVSNGHGGDIAFRMPSAPDLVGSVGHEPTDQEMAIDGGKMDGWAGISGCELSTGFACVSQYQPSQIPNIAALASQYVISDHTFEPGLSASWGSHLELAASTLDGFLGVNPSNSTGGVGWGCDSDLTSPWQPSPGAPIQIVPSCVPEPDGTGAFESTPVKWVPTIMDRLRNAGLSWGIYAPGRGSSGYGWAVCPTFADCLDTTEASHQHDSSKFASVAAAGALPAFSILIPSGTDSQHNSQSMIVGDNWIAQNVQAIMSGPDWSSTAIFITWDDCGCFYDHVSPPGSEGIRVPMIIVSPYAKAAYDDSTPATFDSLLAFTEHVFGLAPLNASDGSVYDYSNSFTVTLSAKPGATRPAVHGAVHLVQHALSPAQIRALRNAPPDPPNEDDT
jgi:phospholipase C